MRAFYTKASILILVLLFVSLFWYSRHIPQETIETEKFLVVYEIDGDSVSYFQYYVLKGDSLYRPAFNPSKDGYVFDDWYLDDHVLDFTSYVVNKDIVIKAGYVKIVKVDFVSDTDEIIYSTTQLEGEKLPKPQDPTKVGYTFIGWYNGDKLYDFNSSLTNDLKLVAKFEINTYTVTFVWYGGFDDYVVRVNYNDKVEAPTDHQRNIYQLSEWYDDNDDTFDFDTPIQEDTTIYAQWYTMVSTEQEFIDALAASEDTDMIIITNEIVLTQSVTITKKIMIDGQGNRIVLDGPDVDIIDIDNALIYDLDVDRKP